MHWFEGRIGSGGRIAVSSGRSSTAEMDVEKSYLMEEGKEVFSSPTNQRF